MKDPENCRVAAVLGNKVQIYGPSHDGFRAKVNETHVFRNYGQAKAFAAEYDDKQRIVKVPK